MGSGEVQIYATRTPSENGVEVGNVKRVMAPKIRDVTRAATFWIRLIACGSALSASHIKSIADHRPAPDQPKFASLSMKMAATNDGSVLLQRADCQGEAGTKPYRVAMEQPGDSTNLQKSKASNAEPSQSPGASALPESGGISGDSAPSENSNKPLATPVEGQKDLIDVIRPNRQQQSD